MQDRQGPPAQMEYDCERVLAFMPPYPYPIGAQRLWVRVNDEVAEARARRRGLDFERISRERLQYLLGVLCAAGDIEHGGTGRQAGWRKTGPQWKPAPTGDELD